jgi:hypothetical protein
VGRALKWYEIAPHSRPFVTYTEGWILGLNLDLDATEYDPAGNTYQWEESGLYFTGLEVYHSLHCLVSYRPAFFLNHT